MPSTTGPQCRPSSSETTARPRLVERVLSRTITPTPRASCATGATPPGSWSTGTSKRSYGHGRPLLRTVGAKVSSSPSFEKRRSATPIVRSSGSTASGTASAAIDSCRNARRSVVALGRAGSKCDTSPRRSKLPNAHVRRHPSQRHPRHAMPVLRLRYRYRHHRRHRHRHLYVYVARQGTAVTRVPRPTRSRSRCWCLARPDSGWVHQV